ncbi:MAG: sugar phosphate isomerase/epimerase family protein [Armatimonadota bacterium]|nr:sugar phosphate isomerase/epimerase family protein [Armatimonadota bacterium]
MNRREFLRMALGTTAAFRVATTRSSAVAPTHQLKDAGDPGSLKKAVILDMIPERQSLEERFALARDLGFQGLEVRPADDLSLADQMREAAQKTGIRLHSVMFGGWQAPLSSPDKQTAEKGAEGIRSALKFAKEVGADGVLVVPAVVNEQVRYAEAYERSQRYLRELAKYAEKFQVRILVENVWNNFLLSPLEFARYIDEIGSPWVQAYFDVGNVLAFGWPEDWIRTLGKRIKKIHLKDFKKGPRQFVNLREGDVNWREVRKALREIGYSGYLTAELRGGDEEYLRDLSSRMDAIIRGSD